MIRVALDSDGLITAWLESVLDIVYEVTGKRYQPSDITTWNPFRSMHLTKAEEQAVLDECAAPGFCTSIAAVPGAIEAVKRLMAKHDVYIVTTPWEISPTWESERTAWLMSHLGIARDRIVSTAGKHVVAADFFCDDNVGNVLEWTVHNDGAAFLFASHHNANKAANMPTVTGWSELEAEVAKVAAQVHR